jgi:lipopolysaccharide/colanic/teichoic acid biosynthesis glycosyltransferase
MRQLQLAIKRSFDVVSCTAILLVGWPLFALLAVLVRLSSPGPVLFMQERMGLHEKPYKMLKYRTMSGQPDVASTKWSSADEARVTKVGRFLRDYGLDELPQTINILKGDMSIIGPRPPLPQQVIAFTPRQRRMFEMRPGVLSLAAIEGRRSLPMEKRYELHVKYVETWSIQLDAKILWRGLLVVLGKEGASE